MVLPPPDTEAAPGLPALDDDAWDDLLNYIEEKRVIPIVGPELLRVETDAGPRLLYDWLAEKLAVKLNVDLRQLPQPCTLNDVVCWYLAARGRREEAYTRLRSILRETNFAVPPALRQLAQITDFDLFITTTFDPLLEQALKVAPQIEDIAGRFYARTDFLYLGRGINYPIALEGALKLKEISYIHAEAYAAGELKHGPLALVDDDMPVVAVAPNTDLLEKLKSNLMEVRARGGELIVFADPESGLKPSDGVTVITMPKHVSYIQAPLIYTLPLQLLSYHVATARGTDVDKPRNLAKSVTVE
mgnify:CR=1 FL=1